MRYRGGRFADRDDELDAVRWFALEDAEQTVAYASEQALVRARLRAARAEPDAEHGARSRAARRAGAEPRPHDRTRARTSTCSGARDACPARRRPARRREPPPAVGGSGVGVARCVLTHIHPDHVGGALDLGRAARGARSRAGFTVGGRPLAPETRARRRRRDRVARRAAASSCTRPATSPGTAASTSPSAAGCSPGIPCSRRAPPSSRRPTATWRRISQSLAPAARPRRRGHLPRARAARRAAATALLDEYSRTGCCASARSSTRCATARGDRGAGARASTRTCIPDSSGPRGSPCGHTSTKLEREGAVVAEPAGRFRLA